MATTSTVVDSIVLATLTFHPIKMTHKFDVSDNKEAINFWYREGRRGASIT